MKTVHQSRTEWNTWGGKRPGAGRKPAKIPTEPARVPVEVMRDIKGFMDATGFSQSMAFLQMWRGLWEKQEELEREIIELRKQLADK